MTEFQPQEKVIAVPTIAEIIFFSGYETLLQSYEHYRNVDANWVYDPEDPCAVQLEFPDYSPYTTWTFSRDILSSALDKVDQEGAECSEVLIRTVDKETLGSDFPMLHVSLRSPGEGTGNLLLNAKDALLFYTLTVEAVVPGREYENDDAIDGWIAEIRRSEEA